MERRRSTGTTRTLGEIATAYRKQDREASQAADIAAVESGVTVTVISEYRGEYGGYPRNFRGCYLDLTPDGLVIRPLLLFSFLWKRIPVNESVIAARVREYTSEREALLVGGGGRYAPGGTLQQSGMVPISCETSGGLLEFAVPRPDIKLILHYLARLSLISLNGLNGLNGPGGLLLVAEVFSARPNRSRGAIGQHQHL